MPCEGHLVSRRRRDIFFRDGYLATVQTDQGQGCRLVAKIAFGMGVRLDLRTGGCLLRFRVCATPGEDQQGRHDDPMARTYHEHNPKHEMTSRSRNGPAASGPHSLFDSGLRQIDPNQMPG